MAKWSIDLEKQTATSTNGITFKQKGYVITAAHDRNTTGAGLLARELSCEAAISPARVAELCDVVLTVVSDDAAMHEVFAEASPNSLLAHAKGRLNGVKSTWADDARNKLTAIAELEDGNE